VSTSTLSRRACLRGWGRGLGFAALGLLTACGGTAQVSTTTTSAPSLAATTAPATSAPAVATSAVATSVSAASPTASSARAAATVGSTTASTVATTSAASTPATATSSVPTGSASSTPVPAAGGAAGASTGIEYWQYNAQVKDVEAAQVAIFVKQNPKIPVNYVVNANFTDYFTKIDTSFAGGTPPDVWNTAPTYYFEYIQRGQLTALDPLIRRDLDLTQFFEQTLNQWDAPPGSGKKYGIPRDWVVNVLYYNTDLLQKAGVPPPTDDWTNDTLRDAGAKITKDTGDGSTAQFGISGWPYVDMVLANGGKVLNDARTRCVLDQSAPALDTLAYLADAVQKTKALAKSGYLKGDPWRESRLGFTVRLTTLIGSMVKTPVAFQWGVAKAPKGSQARKAYGGPDGLVISNKPATVAPSWEFIKFLIGKDAQVPLAVSWGGLPVNRAAAASPEFLGTRAAAYQTGLDSAPYMYDLYDANYGKWMAALNKQVNDAQAGTIAPKDAIAQATHDINGLLTQVYPNG
jgi:multiple sugar transport system substrate-binding protein